MEPLIGQPLIESRQIELLVGTIGIAIAGRGGRASRIGVIEADFWSAHG